MRHHAFGIKLQRFLEALAPFAKIEPEAPIEAQIEPALRRNRIG
jgi:hypothetical protein